MIDVQRYCGLSQQTDFQNWLKSISENLYDELMKHLDKREGCGSNKNKMKMIYARIKSMDKENELIDFVKKFYPHLIIRTEQNSITKIKDESEIVKPIHTDLNVHKVFPQYAEKALVFPQRKIFIGPSFVTVNNIVINFIQHHLGTDYIILENNGTFHGYIEYFDKKYEKIISKVPMEKRHINIFKIKNGLK